jgi:PIN domain nuclease of toxin-antitoxin system
VNHFLPLAMEISHALTIKTLPPHHRDPFDRILLAQAICEDLTIVTRDPNVLQYSVSHIVA